MSVFVVVIKEAIILWFLNSDMFPIMVHRVYEKFNLSSNFLEMSSNSAFVNGTFTKADAIHSTIALQQLLTIYHTALNEILY